MRFEIEQEMNRKNVENEIANAPIIPIRVSRLINSIKVPYIDYLYDMNVEIIQYYLEIFINK